jgi:hypothetical protein
MRSLEKLELQFNSIKHADENAFRGLKVPPLYLSDNKFEVLHPNLFKDLQFGSFK